MAGGGRDVTVVIVVVIDTVIAEVHMRVTARAIVPVRLKPDNKLYIVARTIRHGQSLHNRPVRELKPGPVLIDQIMYTQTVKEMCIARRIKVGKAKPEMVGSHHRKIGSHHKNRHKDPHKNRRSNLRSASPDRSSQVRTINNS